MSGVGSRVAGRSGASAVLASVSYSEVLNNNVSLAKPSSAFNILTLLYLYRETVHFSFRCKKVNK